MIRIGDVWDRTVDVLQGRAGILTGIAALTIVVPGAANGALRAFLPSRDPLLVAVPLVAFASIVLMVYGVLAMTAVASDPTVDRAAGFGIARRRLLPALGVIAAMIVVAGLLFVPAVVLLMLAGVVVRPGGGMSVPAGSSGALLAATFAILVTLSVGLWLSARIVPLFGVVVNERHGLGALRRSLQLSRGSTLKLVGVLILYLIVVLVVTLAATSVFGIVIRLLLGADSALAIFLITLVSALVSALTTVVQTVFYARFYVAAVERERREASLA